MAAASPSRDQPPRGGGVSEPTDAQLDGATADGAPTPSDEAFAESGEGASEGGAAGDDDELAAERERNLRLRAEIENVRNRTGRELAEQRRYASLALARDLLPVLDNVDRAIAAAGEKHDAESLLEGFRLVRQQLAAALARHDCTEIQAQGAEFDPQWHEAILHQPSADAPAGQVTTVTQAGYQMHDRVVRPAQVIVSSGPSSG